jgi:hypothetical protein
LPQLAAQIVPVFDPQQIIPVHPAFVVHVTPIRMVPLEEPLLDPLELPLEELPLELPLLEPPLEEPPLLPPLELLPLGLSLVPLLHPKSAAATTDTTPTARPIFMTCSSQAQRS